MLQHTPDSEVRQSSLHSPSLVQPNSSTPINQRSNMDDKSQHGDLVSPTASKLNNRHVKQNV
jgi:hypothetical protein